MYMPLWHVYSKGKSNMCVCVCVCVCGPGGGGGGGGSVLNALELGSLPRLLRQARESDTETTAHVQLTQVFQVVWSIP